MPNERKYFYLVIKDKQKTAVMQGFGVFENFKFVGGIQGYSGVFTESFVNVFDKVQKSFSDKEYQVVGLIIPNEVSLFLPDHKVISTGNEWMTVEELAKNLKGPAIEIVDCGKIVENV